jgi:hypothetical protein
MKAIHSDIQTITATTHQSIQNENKKLGIKVIDGITGIFPG